MIVRPILSAALTLVATIVSANGDTKTVNIITNVTPPSGGCVCHLGYAATGVRCPTYGKLVPINGVCTIRKWTKFNLKMSGRINKDVVEATRVLRQKFGNLDSVEKKNVNVQARIKVRQQGKLLNPLRLGLRTTGGCGSQKFTRCSFSLSDTAPERTPAAGLATTTIGTINNDKTTSQIVQQEFDSGELYFDVTADFDAEGSRVQTLIDAGESLVGELGLENLLLVRAQASGELTKPDAANLQVTIKEVTKSILEVDVYAIANNVVNDLEDTTEEWLEPHTQTLADDFKNAAKVSENSNFSFAVITSSGETKKSGENYNVNQGQVVYVFNPALVYGFAVGGTLIAVIGIGACVAAIVVPKCLAKKKRNTKIHVEEEKY